MIDGKWDVLLTRELHSWIALHARVELLVLVDGVDVTDRCVLADHLSSFVLCYRLNEDGKKYLDESNGLPAMEVLRGVVTYSRKALD